LKEERESCGLAITLILPFCCSNKCSYWKSKQRIEKEIFSLLISKKAFMGHGEESGYRNQRLNDI
jgi:hypothetical protein